MPTLYHPDNVPAVLAPVPIELTPLWTPENFSKISLLFRRLSSNCSSSDFSGTCSCSGSGSVSTASKGGGSGLEISCGTGTRFMDCASEAEESVRLYPGVVRGTAWRDSKGFSDRLRKRLQVSNARTGRRRAHHDSRGTFLFPSTRRAPLVIPIRPSIPLIPPILPAISRPVPIIPSVMPRLVRTGVVPAL